MNQQQGEFVSPYPPPQPFQFSYPYAQPGAPPPQLPYQYQPPHGQPLPQHQQVPQQPPQYFRPYNSIQQNLAPGPPTSAAPPHPQFRGPTAAAVVNASSSSPPNANNNAGAAGPAQPHSQDADDQDDDQAGDDTVEQYGPHGSDEHGAIFNIPPPPESTYPNEEELEKAIHAWSKEHGYELVRRASKRNAKGMLYKRYYHCSKHGKRANTGKLTEEQRQRTNRKSGRVDCPMSLAAVAVDPSDPEGEWQIRHRKTHHNHGPTKAVELAGHRRRARGGNVEKAIDGLFAIGTTTAQVLQFLQKTNPEGLFTRTDVANMKNRYKKWGTCADRIQRGENHISTVGYKNKLGIPIPCIPCRQRMLTCGNERPDCKNCKRSGTTCEYSHEQTGIEDTTMHDAGESTQIDLTADDQLQQEADNAARPAPSSTTIPKPTPAQAQEIFKTIRNFTVEHIKPHRLSLDSSSVEVLAQSSCGNGDSYKGLPFLNSERDWPPFRDAMIEATLKENTHDVLTGLKQEPAKPLPPPGSSNTTNPNNVEIDIEPWNEYIKQLAIYNRRNSLLISALLSKTSPLFRTRILYLPKANEAWTTLEDMCAPRGSEAAFALFNDIHNTTLASCNNNLTQYISRLEAAYAQFTQLKCNARLTTFGRPATTSLDKVAKRKETAKSSASKSSAATRSPAVAAGAVGPGPVSQTGSDALPDEMMVFLFLKGLGPEWAQWVEALCLTSNVGGFGTGERLGFREVCKAATRQEGVVRKSAAARGGAS